MAEYVPVPVAAAREVAERYAKSVVVITSFDRAHATVHTTTYGVEPADKIAAANLGDKIAQQVCGDGIDRQTRYEDFRHVDAAKRAQQIEKLTTACKAADALILSLLAVRDGAADELLRDVRDACGAALATLEDSGPPPSTLHPH